MANGFDLVVGPVANDTVYEVLKLFFIGAYTPEQTVAQLLPHRLKDQYAFKTERALSFLSFQEVRDA